MSARQLWCNPSLGVAGDMLLAALLDVGADERAVSDQLALLDLPGWRLDVVRTTRRGLVATRVDVVVEEQQHHRPWSTIDDLLAGSGLDPEIAAGARRTFRALGEAEALVHGVSIDDVHFHEVGALDAIVDIVGCWAALVALGATTVTASAVGLGAGTAAMAHGRVQVPAPATLELLLGVPTVPVHTERETATPTGVALLTTMVSGWGPPPAGTLLATGRGAGSWDPDTHPNVVTAVLSEPAAAGAHDDHETVSAVLLETNLDDVTPEVLAHVVDRAIRQGADDAWVTPVVMKKGRAAHQLSVLCRPELSGELRELVARETGTLGLRERRVAKHELRRRTQVVQLDGCSIRVKIGPHAAKAEHDDLVEAQRVTGRPLQDLAAAAVAAARASDARS